MYDPATRERSPAGTSAAEIAPPVMSSIITPMPLKNSARNSMPSTSGRAPPASGTSISGAGNSTQPIAKAGPTPTRRCTAPVTTDPITLPIAPAPITRPSAPAFTCSVLVANRIQSAKNMKLNRLMVAVAPSEARMIGLRAMNRSPAITPPLPASGSGSGSGESIPRMNSAEATNESASTPTASGAVSACTSRPPMAGPAMNDTARLPFSSELPVMNCSRGTSTTNRAL